MAQESAVLIAELLLQSLAVSMVSITLLISLIYRSWRFGMISVLPNFLPILVALGVNGWFDIPLRLGIVMIYSLGLGIAVDDTVHIMTRFVQEREQNPGATVRQSLLNSLRTAGVALVVTTAILFFGALCFLPANFQPVRDVGILLTVIVATALVADLFVLPVLIERTRS